MTQYQSSSLVEDDSSEVNNASTKSPSPNWSDAEIHFLITTWKDHHPISKRHNAAVWESIVKQLNNLLREQGLCPFARHPNANLLKNLEDEYKRVKDHNNISRNNRETFTYYVDLNEITPKAVIEYGFEDDRLPINICPSCSGKKSTPSMPETEEELSDSSVGDEEGQLLANALFRCELASSNKGKKTLASALSSSKWQSPRSTASSEAGDEHLAFSELLFVRRKRPGSKAREKASGKSNQATAKKERIKWPQLQWYWVFRFFQWKPETWPRLFWKAGWKGGGKGN